MMLEDYAAMLAERCYQIADGKINEEGKQATINEAIGAFGRTPIIGVNVRDACQKRNWHMLAGALMACSSATSTSGNIHVTQTANPNVTQQQTTAITISQTVDAINRSLLDDNDKKELKALIADLQTIDKQDTKSFVNKFKDGLEIAKGSADLVKTLLSFGLSFMG